MGSPASQTPQDIRAAQRRKAAVASGVLLLAGWGIVAAPTASAAAPVGAAPNAATQRGVPAGLAQAVRSRLGSPAASPDGWDKGKQVAELTASDGAGGSLLGWSVALSSDGSTALVGAWNHAGKGAAYVFSDSGGTWTQTAELTASDGASGDAFGISGALSADGTTAIVGAYTRDDSTGAAYVFSDSGGSWQQTAELTAADAAAGDAFGYAVALSAKGSTAIVGAFGRDTDTGAAYVFTHSGKAWKQKAELMAPDGGIDEDFGYSVALTAKGSTAIVGAYGHNGYVGAAYLFAHTGGAWTEQAELAPSDGADGDSFGYSVALTAKGSEAVIGAYGHHTEAGAAYVFSQNGGTWTQTAELSASDGAPYDDFGDSVAVSAKGSTVLVGAEDHNGHAGAAYVFTEGRTGFKQAELAASDGAANDYFGISVGLSGNGATALVGAFGDDGNAGAAYIFGR